jgi:hypothetical protein
LGTISLTNPIAGTVIAAGLHATNYTVIQTVINGNLDTNNWATGKIFAPSKLMQEAATVGQKLEWNGTIWVPASLNYATTLPGSPADGQETILVDSTAAPTYAWRLRFNSTLAKWQCIGGVPKVVTVATAEATSSTTYANLTTNGPDFTTPVAGDWQITVQARITAESGSNIAFMSYDVGGTGALDIDSAQGNIATPEKPTLSALSVKTGVAASTLLRGRYKNGGATSLTYADRRLIVIPIQVS